MRTLVALLVLALAWPTSAMARDRNTNQVTPGKAGMKRQPDTDPSRGGTRRGGIELALASLTAVLTGVLIGRGTWELVRASRVRKRCAERTDVDPFAVEVDPDCGVRRPGLGGRISGGLSLGFAVPIGIASGFLFAYGLKINRHYRKLAAERKLAITPWLGRSGAGVGVRLRF